MKNSTLPFITVVMPIRNEARFIGDTLDQLVSQEYPVDRYEILVVDGMSDDGSSEIVRKMAEGLPQVRLLSNPRWLSSAGRNVGFRSGRGELFLVVDGHCFIPDRMLLKNVAHCFAVSGAGCLGRPQPLDPPGLTLFQRCVAAVRGSRLGHGGDSLIYTEFEGTASPVSNGAAYRREVFQKIGYVDEEFDACEDLEFNYRVEEAHITAYTSPKLTVRYYPRETLGEVMSQMVRYGRGRLRFMAKHPSAITLNQLLPAGLVVGLSILVILPILAVMGPHLPGPLQHWRISRLAVAVLWLYLLYFLIVLAESLRLSVKEIRGAFRYLPWIFIIVHVGLGWGIVAEALRGVGICRGYASGAGSPSSPGSDL